MPKQSELFRSYQTAMRVGTEKAMLECLNVMCEELPWRLRKFRARGLDYEMLVNDARTALWNMLMWYRNHPKRISPNGTFLHRAMTAHINKIGALYIDEYQSRENRKVHFEGNEDWISGWVFPNQQALTHIFYTEEFKPAVEREFLKRSRLKGREQVVSLWLMRKLLAGKTVSQSQIKRLLPDMDKKHHRFVRDYTVVSLRRIISDVCRKDKNSIYAEAWEHIFSPEPEQGSYVPTVLQGTAFEGMLGNDGEPNASLPS